MGSNKMYGISKNLGRNGVWLLLSVTLTGCAEYMLNRDGLALMERGDFESGIKKLSEASASSPRNANYRADYVRSLEQTLNRLLAKANSEKGAGNQDNAKALFEQVLKFDPDNSRAKLGLEELAMDSRHGLAVESAIEMLNKGDIEAAQGALRPVLLENPKNGRAILLQRQIEERIARDQASSIALKSKFKKPVNLQFRDANLRLVFEALSRTSGINVILDREVKDNLKTTVFVNDVSVEDTIDIILLQNQLEKRILNENSVLVYPSTPAKLKEYRELKIRTFHLVNADAKQMLTMIKTLLKTKDMFVHEKTNSLVMRDTPEAIRLAEKIIADQDGSDPEVMLEVEVLEVSSSRLSELGINFPNQLTISPTNAQGSTTGLTLSDLGNINRGRLAVNSLSATLNLKLQDGDVNMLASPRIRVRSREKAKILIGDRVPVISQATQLGAGGTTSSSSSVNYLDVGLKLEVEPDIHVDREVGIKINLEVSNIVREVQVGSATSGFTLAYQVGTRSTSTVLRLKDGETQVLAGLINDDDRKSSSKIPVLGQMPILGRLFSSERDNGSKTEIILSITPRIIGNMRLPESNEIEFWSGTEDSLRTKSISLKTIGAESVIATNDLGMGRPTQSQRSEARPQPQSQLQPQPDLLPQMSKPVAVTDSEPAVVAAAGMPTMAMSWMGPVQAKIGSKINLTLNGQSDQVIGGISFVVNYDPGVLRVNKVSEGNFWKQSGASTTFTKIVDEKSGQIIIEVTQPAGQEGVKGEGSIMTLNFDVIAGLPRSQITVTRIKPIDAAGNALSAAFPEPYNIRLRP